MTTGIGMNIFTRNMRFLLDKAKQIGFKIVLFTMPPATITNTNIGNIPMLYIIYIYIYIYIIYYYYNNECLREHRCKEFNAIIHIYIYIVSNYKLPTTYAYIYTSKEIGINSRPQFTPR